MVGQEFSMGSKLKCHTSKMLMIQTYFVAIILSYLEHNSCGNFKSFKHKVEEKVCVQLKWKKNRPNSMYVSTEKEATDLMLENNNIIGKVWRLQILLTKRKGLITKTRIQEVKQEKSRSSQWNILRYRTRKTKIRFMNV